MVVDDGRQHVVHGRGEAGLLPGRCGQPAQGGAVLGTEPDAAVVERPAAGLRAVRPRLPGLVEAGGTDVAHGQRDLEVGDAGPHRGGQQRVGLGLEGVAPGELVGNRPRSLVGRNRAGAGPGAHPVRNRARGGIKQPPRPLVANTQLLTQYVYVGLGCDAQEVVGLGLEGVLRHQRPVLPKPP